MTRTPFNQETFDEICEQIADGKSLREICQAENMPNKSSVFRWLAKDPVLCDQYARAREAQADAIVDEILSIADDASNDFMERQTDAGASWVVNGEHIQRSRVRIDARKWLAGKLRPKVYGEKLDLNHTGAVNVTLESDAEKL
jgi:hypothetical protein